MNKEEIYIEPPKTNYIVLTTNLDNLELARYIEKIPDTYFATFPYVECYKKLQQENKQLKDNWNKLKEHLIKEIDDWEDVNDTINDETVISMVQEDKNILLKMQELESGGSDE